jgi:predicted TPR repeat methyltransferase
MPQESPPSGDAVELLRNEQIEPAETALAAILDVAPNHADALHFMGVLRYTQARFDEAVALIRQSLEVAPTNAGAWNNLGNVLLGAERFDDAAHAYEQSVAAAQGTAQSAQSADALANLGTLYRKRGKPQSAEQACRRALEVRPDSAAAWYGLSEALMAQGKVNEGLLANSRAIALLPEHSVARDQVIRALLLLGEHARAADLYREWLAEEPDNPLAQHHLAACIGDAPPERASDAYVEQVFDSFAASFDAKLEKLNYRAPELVARALAAAVGEPRANLRIADVGCGTGLCGPLVKPWASHLAGCDLSVGMLRLARERRVYDVLHKAELVFYLDTQPAMFDAVISADTLCYFGALDGAMAAAARALRAGGVLVFTVEALQAERGAPHHLQGNGRYTHARAHVEAAVRGASLALVGCEADTLRLEAGLPVAGWVVTARNG